MGATKLDIWNMALGKISEAALQSETETSTQGQRCRLHYDQALSEVLAGHTWNCATRRSQLSPLEETPVFGYEYKYNLPADCIRVVDVYNEDGEFYPDEKWTLQGGTTLLSDLSALNMEYVFLVEDTLDLSPLCVEAVINKLATKLAYQSTKSRNMVADLINEYEAVIIPRAIAIEELQNNDRLRRFTNEWLESRNKLGLGF